MELEPLAEIVNQMVQDDRARDVLLSQIDDAINVRFDPDPAIKELPYVKNRHHAMTDIADARNAGARTFSTLLPSIEIAPLSELDEEYDRVEKMEQVLDWEFARMNRNSSKKGIHEQIVDSAISYHTVCLQTEYLPYKFKGTTSTRIKNLLANKVFNWTLHHPSTVHAVNSDYGLERVAKVSRLSLQNLIDNFGKDNKGIRKLLASEKWERADYMKTFYNLVDYTDYEDRVQWAIPENSDVSASEFVFMNEKHKLPFIPWVIVDYGDPLWKSIIQSGQWENYQYANLIQFAKAIEQSTRSTMVIRTPDGTLKNVWMDFSNPSNPIVLPLDGSVVDNIQPAPIDPGLATATQQMGNAIAKSTVAQILQDISGYANAPFSTVSQVVQMALGQLSPAKKAAENAEAQALYQMFQWIEHSKIPLIGYRNKNTDSRMQDGDPNKRGESIGIFPGSAPSEEELAQLPEGFLSNRLYFDLEALYITVALKSSNESDAQTRLNVQINAVDRLGMSKQQAWENMGWKNYEINQNQRGEETMFEAELQKEVQKKQLEIEALKMQMQSQNQMQMQQAQQQMQQEQMAQQQQPQNAVQDLNGANSMSTMQGADMRGGQNPAMMVAPGLGREQVTGQTVQESQ